jgi:glycosyltransferase involved in cell wall biosynthesis
MPTFLVVAQKVDAKDANLGFFVEWLRALSAHAELEVIANEVGEHSFPPHVHVHSLGKESGRGRLARFFTYQRLLARLLPRVQAVLYHMCPEYVIAAHVFPHLLGKPTALWYAHGAVTPRLRLAERLVWRVLTSSASGFRLSSRKVSVLGQGIDTRHFFPATRDKKKDELVLLTAGRISKAKNLEVIIDAVGILVRKGFPARLRVAGEPITSVDRTYREALDKKISDMGLSGRVEFVGGVPYGAMPAFYQSGDIFVNTSATGSLDKAVLEAVSCGLLPATSNDAFIPLFGQESGLIFSPGDAGALAERVERLQTLTAAERDQLSRALRARVEKDHNLGRLAERLVRSLTELYHKKS